jgi:hypothetical protein
LIAATPIDLLAQLARLLDGAPHRPIRMLADGDAAFDTGDSVVHDEASNAGSDAHAEVSRRSSALQDRVAEIGHTLAGAGSDLTTSSLSLAMVFPRVRTVFAAAMSVGVGRQSVVNVCQE